MSLLLSADAVAESSLQTELMEIQERWRHAHHRLDQQRRELQGLIKVRSSTYSQSFLTRAQCLYSLPFVPPLLFKYCSQHFLPNITIFDL